MTTQTIPSVSTPPSSLSDFSVNAERIADYRRDGFVKVEQIIPPDVVAAAAPAALAIAKENISDGSDYTRALNQTVNVWPEIEALRAVTLHPNICAAASQLAGKKLRVWHDHVLVKNPQNGQPTCWHQDQPYWPHGNSVEPISAWVALCDVNIEMGCMSFMPGLQERTDLPMQNLSDPRSLYNFAPELEFHRSVTLPLRAGDCTFHHGRTPHRAGQNFSDDYRLAHVTIFIDRETTFSPGTDENNIARGHIMTNDLDIKTGDLIEGPLFPEV